MLKRQFIKDCVRDVCETFMKLELPMFNANLIQQIMNEMLVRVIIIPGNCEINCSSIREQVAKDIIGKINRMVHESEKVDANVPKKSDGRISFVFGPETPNDEIEDKEDESNKVTLSFFESQFIFAKPFSIFSFFQFDLTGTIKKSLLDFFELITGDSFEFTDSFKTREFIHLYDFHKYYLHKSIENFNELVALKLKQISANHDESKTKNEDQSLSLEDLSNEAAGLIMSYSRSPEKISKSVTRISNYIHYLFI